ncbi:putative transporter [Lasiodiplodia hormozganensis]|uniref:Transporter n=1 Tax=Lasiodiplodia hormozganensis TaxID=869390 RepID=A0AA39XQA3_9PEZI|nr:putative transporter [Lasiodiplodia hormozganensis]
MSGPLEDEKAAEERKETMKVPTTSDSGQEEALAHQSTLLEDGASHLTQEHREYLLKRHGTLTLDPLPSADPADPYNWPSWKKNANLVLVAFHAMMTTFIAAGIIPAFEDISVDLGCSLQRASYLTSMQIAVLGYSPLFWKPISYRYGRRPVWLISTLGAGVCNIGCAVSHSYAAMSVCRCLVSFFISPAIAIGSGVVVETFFKKDRGRHMGIWTLMVTLGPPTGPFIMGFVAYHVGYRWIFWIYAIINAAQFIGYLFLGPETRYIRQGVQHTGSAFKQEYLNFGHRLDPTPLHFYEFLQPASLARYKSILIPTISYTVVFGFASVFMTVEIPQIFLPKFEFNPQQIGLQFLGIIIGSVLGEQMAGPLSDVWMDRAAKRNGSIRPPPEFRLWLSWLGFLLTIVGLIVFGVRTQQAVPMHWNVTPIIGLAIASVGNQIVTTVLVTYAVDCHPESSSSIGVFVNLIRSTWGFIGPFWFPQMIESIGMSGSGGLMAGIVFVASWLPIILLQIRGGVWRKRGALKEESRPSAAPGRGD